jgi:NADH-quinone oxidoreductase subunit H
LGPVGFIILGFQLWSMMPIGYYSIAMEPIELSVLHVLAISTLSVYGIILGGWASNSKYGMLGGIRSAAQTIAYEIAIGLIIIPIILYSGGASLGEIGNKGIGIIEEMGAFGPLGILIFIGGLAETNRPPFDLPEAEAELVAGYSTEYSAAGSALSSTAEYGNILFYSASVTILVGGGPNWLGIKLSIMIILFIWVRVASPRYRYDQLMRLGWKNLLPLALGLISFYTTTYILPDRGSASASKEELAQWESNCLTSNRLRVRNHHFSKEERRGIIAQMDEQLICNQ